jgi:hypothetical protein
MHAVLRLMVESVPVSCMYNDAVYYTAQK